MISWTKRSLSWTLKAFPQGSHEMGMSERLAGFLPSAAHVACFCFCSYSHRSKRRWSFHGNRSCWATSGVGPLISTPDPLLTVCAWWSEEWCDDLEEDRDPLVLEEDLDEFDTTDRFVGEGDLVFDLCASDESLGDEGAKSDGNKSCPCCD